MHAPARRLFLTSLALAASACVVVAVAFQSRTAHAEGDSTPPKAEAKEATACTCSCCAGLISLSKWPEGEDLFNELMTDAVITELAPQGKKVKQGEVICKFDDRARRKDSMRQLVELTKALGRSAMAKTAHSMAEFELQRYVEATSKQELQLAAAEVEYAKNDVARFETRAKELTQLFNEGRVTEARKTAEDLELQRARVALEQAEIKLKVLKDFQIEMKTRELQMKEASTKADELEKQVLLEMAKGESEAIQRDLRSYTLRAPVDGVIRHAQGIGPDGRPRIEKGAFIKPRQWILRVVTADPLRTELGPGGNDSPIRHLSRAER